jgi:hypothetical protein
MKKLHKTAVISKCEKYRYKLTRTWDEDKGKVLFIMLNPSTANHIENDLTTIRCINFAEKWGCGGIMIGNIYPFRAKRPKDLRRWKTEHDWKIIDAYEYNISHVKAMADEAEIIVCAWGCNHPGIPDWIDSLGRLHYLELCDDGITPKHPLGNLSNDLVPKYKGWNLSSYKLNTNKEG